jgi:ATP-dependent RNA helicase DOB1
MQVTQYAALQQQSARLYGQIVEVMRSPKHALPFLQPGRLIQVSVPTDDSQNHSKAWVTVVNFQKASKRKEVYSASNEDYTMDVLGNCADGASLNRYVQRKPHESTVCASFLTNSQPSNHHRRAIPVSASVKGVPLVISSSLNEVTAFSSIRVYVPKDLRAPEQRALAVKVRKYAAYSEMNTLQERN